MLHIDFFISNSSMDIHIDRAPAYALLLFGLYSLIFGNILFEIFDDKVREYFKTNFYAKHIVAIILLFIIYISTDKNLTTNNVFKIMLSVVLIYIWFILTTKTPFQITITIVFLATTIFILNIYSERYKMESENANDTELLDRITYIRYIQMFLTILMSILTIIGNIMYYNGDSR